MPHAQPDLRQGLTPGRLPYWLIRTLPAEEVRRYNTGQPRDPGGEGGGQWVSAGGGAAGGLKDTLKLAGKIQLQPDEKLLSSAKFDAPAGGVRMALTERAGQRRLRFGAGTEGYGQRNRDEGLAAWDGNPSKPPLSRAERERLDAEGDALDEEYESASPARQDEIDNRLADIREQLTTDDIGFNGTAELDEYAMRRLVDRIRPAMAEAVEQEKAENKAWDEIDKLEAEGNPDPDRMAALRRIVDRDGDITFVEGIVPGSAWGDVHFLVELYDVTSGPSLLVGVQPKGTPDDWGEDKEWLAKFDPAETRKFLRLLEKFAESSASRGRNPEGAMVYERYNDQHAPAGSSTGGQFAPASGGSTAKAKPAAPVQKAAGRPARRPIRPRKPDDGTLSYDAGSNQGTGYNSAAGDRRVHDLQQALNRLGVKDAAGKPLKDDGKLGPKTTAAVKALQQRLGVKADGKVTPALLAQIKSMKSLPAQKRSDVMDFCVRSFGFQFEERSRNSDGRTLEGYAAVFNTPTRIAAVGGDFDEVITPGAFTRSIRSRMPVLQFEHGRDPRVGAVPIGAIEDLSEDSQGLHVRATLFDNPVVEPVRQAIAGRAIKGMSFRFNVVDNGDKWARRSGDVDLRTVGDADVHELGPVVFPAYDSTTVSVRSLLAQLGPEEHRTLLRELAYDLRSIEHPGVGPSARSSGDVGLDQDRTRDTPRLSIRQRLDQGALQARGILK
jgi:HK97 family phage prohead protease